MLTRIVADDSEPTLIASRNWWTRLPMEYLAWSMPHVQVVSDYKSVISTKGQRKFIVELVGSEDEKAAKEFIRLHGLSFHQYFENDRSDEPVVVAPYF
jgi:hypothetical protein